MPDLTRLPYPTRQPKRISFDLAVLEYERFELRAIVLDGEVWFILPDLEAVIPQLRPMPDLLAERDIIQVRRSDLGKNGWALRTRDEYIVLVSEPGAVEGCLRACSMASLALARWITHEAGPLLRAAGLREAEMEMLPIKRHRVYVAGDGEVTRPHVVYRFYDTDDRLLYVGISLTAMQRMAAHKNSKTWWGDVARVNFEHYPDRASARAAERVAIKQESPLHNVAA